MLGFVDALSRVPITILLTYEKKQLECWRETVCVDRCASLDTTERRISDVASLLKSGRLSLVEGGGHDSGIDVKAQMESSQRARWSDGNGVSARRSPR